MDTPIDTDVQTNDADPNNRPLTTSAITSNPSSGTVQILGNRQIHYTPDRGFHGTDTFVYEMTDDGGLTDTVTVTITVPNEPPVVQGYGHDANESSRCQRAG